jgi:hypothetical protein
MIKIMVGKDNTYDVAIEVFTSLDHVKLVYFSGY